MYLSDSELQQEIFNNLQDDNIHTDIHSCSSSELQEGLNILKEFPTDTIDEVVAKDYLHHKIQIELTSRS